MSFSFLASDIPGAYLIDPFISEDYRGVFVKNFERNIFQQNGIEFQCTENIMSRSAKYVIRGMHFQSTPPQFKLLSVLSGAIYDVIIDLRKESETYGQWRGFYLSLENHKSLLIPRRCAHGFIALSENSIVSYMCDGAYAPETESGIFAFDPDIAIEWPIDDLSKAILSERDQKLMTFAEFKKRDFHWGEKET